MPNLRTASSAQRTRALIAFAVALVVVVLLLVLLH